jgi:2,3-bisphosphoglycerate-dependent phosphoglycerate mutase
MKKQLALSSSSPNRYHWPLDWTTHGHSFSECISPQAFFAPLMNQFPLITAQLPKLSPTFETRYIADPHEIPASGRYIILFRHGVSEYNTAARFTGWHDPDLSEKGHQQVQIGWKLLQHLTIGKIFESPQRRAISSSNYAHSVGIHAQIEQSPFLLERHYGDKQGQSVRLLESQLSLEAFMRMRWSYADRPGNEHNPGESLQDVETRLRPYLMHRVLPELEHHSVCIIGQGNGMRTICKIVENLSPEAVENLECLSSEIILYRISEHDTQIEAKYILKNPSIPDPMCLSPQDYAKQRQTVGVL